MKNLIPFLIFSLFISPYADASYEVPGQEQSEFYEMPIDILTIGDEVRMSYTLPLELTGAENRIEVSGHMRDGDQVTLSGPKANLPCDMNQRRCDAFYLDITVNPAMIAELLESRGLSPERIQKQIQISRKFAADPIGVVHF